ncbi:MAG: ATP-dependent helicase, partial [Chloroflexota bacterium]
VARICWLVASGADPASITAVTFNKRVADELGERLAAALQPLAPAVVPRVRTFHALGREILAETGAPVKNLTDRADALRALNGGRGLPAAEMRRFDDGFSRLKLEDELDAAAAERLLGESAEPRADADLLHRFIAYERWLAGRSALDFDDLVRRALSVLRDDAAALTAWRARCTTLLVDEVQDVDRSQLDLAVLLAGERRDIFLVGDDDQTIYAWRLADVRRVLDLAGELPGLRRVDLVTNYRCPRPVVERAVKLISGNKERFAKTIRARDDAAGTLALASDSGDDLDRARRLLATWLPAAPGAHAILARTNIELAPYAAVALERGIPYRAAEDGLLLDDGRVDALLAALPADVRPSVALARAGGRPNRVARSLIAWSLPYRTAADLRIAIAAARQQRVAMRSDDAQLILATAHGTKGLEFDHVAVIGMDEHVFPSRRTLEDSDDPSRALEEERRLAYVAWTRARKSLTLVYDPTAPSVFMTEAFTASELRSRSNPS